MIGDPILVEKIRKVIEDSDDTLTMDEIASLVGTKQPAVQRIIRGNNIPHKRKSLSKIDWTDPKNLDKLKELLDSDLSIREIGKHFGLAACTMSSIVARLGIDTRSREGRKVDWNDPVLKNKLTQMVSSGMLLKDISKELGICHTTVRLGIRTLGLDFKFMEYTEWTDDLLNELKTHISEEFLTIPEISKKMGLSENRIRSAINRYKLPYNISKVRKNIHNKFYDMFTYEGFSIDEISEQTGFAWNTVYRRLIDEFKSRGEYHRLKQSLGERYTMGALNNLGIQFTKEKVYTGLIKCRNYFRIDFEVILDGTKYWIEYNGEQHYREGHFYEALEKNRKSSGRTYITFREQVERDTEVKEYAKDNDIVFIEIPYTITRVDKITSILSEILLKHKNPSEIVKLPKVEI